jgi:hypothetical protein
MIPTPDRLFAMFERGEIEREELHALMAAHARELIAEMEDDRRNPAFAWIESLLARQAAARLVRRHGVRLMREVLMALSSLPEFPHLWNASHPDVPLHCFLRIRREPVFRILRMSQSVESVEILIEHGEAGRGRATQRALSLRRDERWRLRIETAAIREPSP